MPTTLKLVAEPQPPMAEIEEDSRTVEVPLVSAPGRIVVIRRGSYRRVSFEVMAGRDDTGTPRWIRATEEQISRLCRVYVKRQFCGDGDYL